MFSSGVSTLPFEAQGLFLTGLELTKETGWLVKQAQGALPPQCRYDKHTTWSGLYGLLGSDPHAGFPTELSPQSLICFDIEMGPPSPSLSGVTIVAGLCIL